MAVTKATDILTANPDVNIIFAANDGGTIGSVMAVKNKGLAGKVYVFGIDTGDQQLTMLKDSDNILQAITGQDPYGQGYNAMKDLLAAIKTGNAPNKGKCQIASGTLLSRADAAGIDKFQADLKARLGQ
jgi:simple sugar transport system substrate-binding protein/ribose transport system substrate-binding protein